MAKAPTLTTVATGYFSNTQLNANFEAIEAAFENTLSLDGSLPNSMGGDIDMDGNDILNANLIDAIGLTLDGEVVTNLATVPDWKGAWLTATAYSKNDLVREDGQTYIALEAHTSGVFSTDLAALKWELFAAKGTSGAGSGDLLAANNLSDVADADTSLTNLGGGSVGIAIFKDTTAAAVRTEISAQQQDDNLDFLSVLTAASNKVPYFDSASSMANLDFLDEDNMASDSATAVPSQQSVKAYVDSSVATAGWEFISSTDLTNDATADFTGFNAANYDAYCFVLQNVIPGTDNVDLYFRTSTDGGTSYDSGASDYGWAAHGVSTSTTVTTAGNQGSTRIELTHDSIGSSAGEDGLSGLVWVLGPHLSKQTRIVFSTTWTGFTTTDDFHMAHGGGVRHSSADVDAVRFLMSSGTLESGTITMYGLRNS